MSKDMSIAEVLDNVIEDCVTDAEALDKTLSEAGIPVEVAEAFGELLAMIFALANALKDTREEMLS